MAAPLSFGGRYSRHRRCRHDRFSSCSFCRWSSATHRHLFTGYYEPELAGSLYRTPAFAYPIYAKPPELTEGSVWYSREEIESRGLLRGRGLEIAWLDDPVEVFFLQVQGSGRIRLTDGRVIRVGYAAKNGQPYRSIGKELIRRGTHTADEVSAQEIRAWVRNNPMRGR